MAHHRYHEGDVVLVSTLSKTGTVVARLQGLSYRVAIGSIAMVCKETELSPSSAQAQNTPKVTIRSAGKEPKAPSSIDLHGLTVDEATRKLESWLTRAIMSGLSQGKVIHGLGTGKLQRATHETLQKFSAVRAFRINDGNPGETNVYF